MTLLSGPRAQEFEPRHDGCGAARNLSSEMRALAQCASIGRRLLYSSVGALVAHVPRLYRDPRTASALIPERGPVRSTLCVTWLFNRSRTMADTSASGAASAAAAPPAEAGSPKKSKSGGSAAKKPRSKPAHPRTSEMVYNAIKSLKERGGSSLQAIKKYIAANYKVDSEKHAPFIKKYLKTAVSTGDLVQTKGDYLLFFFRDIHVF